MKLSFAVTILAAIASVSAFPSLLKRDNTTEPCKNKTILLSNDDGWAATNIRATYRELKAAGYEVILVAPVSQRSGYGGSIIVPTTVNLTTNGEFSYPPAGSPSWGHEEDDLNVWYFNGTPSTSVLFGLDYVIPKYFNNRTVDLVVSGPNEGNNVGPAVFTGSGTVGATYTAVGRGIPAIAFSGANTNNSFFKDDAAQVNNKTFPPNIYGKKVVELVDNLFASQKNYPHLLPLTTGLNVNFPVVGENCQDPEWVLSRLSGPNSIALGLSQNQTTGLFSLGFVQSNSVAQSIFGDIDLPSEATIGLEKCKTSISVFSIDYDASYQQYNTVLKALGGILA